MKIRGNLEKSARITFEQKIVTEDRRCITLHDFESVEEVRDFVNSLYSDLSKKKDGASKCKLKVQVLDYPSDKKSGKMKKTEWSFWLYDCSVNAIERIIEKLS